MRKTTLLALAFALTALPATQADGVPEKKPTTKSTASPFDHWFGLNALAGFSNTKIKASRGDLTRESYTGGGAAGEKATIEGKTHISRSHSVGLGISAMKNVFVDDFYVGADISTFFHSMRSKHSGYGTNANLASVNYLNTTIKALPSYQARLLLGYSFWKRGLVYLGGGVSRDAFKISSTRRETSVGEAYTDRIEKRKISPVFTMGYRHLIAGSGHTANIEFNYKPDYNLHHRHFYGATDSSGHDYMNVKYKVCNLSVMASLTFKIL